MAHRFIVTVAAGAALTVGMAACTGKSGTTETTATPDGEGEPMPTANPPPPDIEIHTNPPAQPVLPTWDEVASGHPEGATNPPMPRLRLNAEGQCFKEWVDPRMGPPGPVKVEEGLDTTGMTEIACTDEGSDAYAAWVAAQKPVNKNPPAPE